MRSFDIRQIPEYLIVDWSTAKKGTAIFIGINAFMSPAGNIIKDRIKEFKDVAKYNGVILAAMEEYKTIGDDEKLLGFWFHCIGTTPAKPKVSSKGYDAECVNDLIKIFKSESEKMLDVKAIMKGYGIIYHEPKVRKAIDHLVKIGFLTSHNERKESKGRPRTLYKPTEELLNYTPPTEFDRLLDKNYVV